VKRAQHSSIRKSLNNLTMDKELFKDFMVSIKWRLSWMNHLKRLHF